MLMSTWRLLALRLFNVTLGRGERLSLALRRVLERRLVWRRGRDRYSASARFFDPRELGQPQPPERPGQGAIH